MMPGAKQRLRWGALILMGLLLSAMAVAAPPNGESTVEDLKARVASAGVGDRPRLCVQIAERQMSEASKLYAAGEIEKAQEPLTDVVAFSELARDYSIQSHKYQKQTEIAVRGMARKLTEIMHSLTRQDEPPVREAMQRLQRVQDDLLAAMFSKGAK